MDNNLNYLIRLSQELLYQKSYESENCSDSKENETRAISERESTDILNLLYRGLEFVLLPERVVSTKEFISLAKELSNLKLDIEHNVSVRFLSNITYYESKNDKE